MRIKYIFNMYLSIFLILYLDVSWISLLLKMLNLRMSCQARIAYCEIIKYFEFLFYFLQK